MLFCTPPLLQQYFDILVNMLICFPPESVMMRLLMLSYLSDFYEVIASSWLAKHDLARLDDATSVALSVSNKIHIPVTIKLTKLKCYILFI